MIFLKENKNRSLIIIPAYNEELNISKTLLQIPESIDVLVVNDGSTDETVNLCKGSNIKVVNHQYNRGYESALETGVNYFLKSNYDKFVVIDADGEIDPKDATQILKSLNSVNPIICGYRKAYRGRLIERVISKISNLLFDIKDIYCGCKGFHISVIKHYSPSEISRGIFTEFVLKKSRKIKVVNMPVAGIVREGQSKFGSGFLTSFKLFINFMIGVIKALFVK